jgi:hypothetical protein
VETRREGFKWGSGGGQRDSGRKSQPGGVPPPATTVIGLMENLLGSQMVISFSF